MNKKYRLGTASNALVCVCARARARVCVCAYIYVCVFVCFCACAGGGGGGVGRGINQHYGIPNFAPSFHSGKSMIFGPCVGLPTHLRLITASK